MTLHLYQQLVDLLAQEPVVLATVIAVKGSAPREVGAKMIVTAAGQTYHTIGGGAGEAMVIQQAHTVLTTGLKQRIEIDLTGVPQRQTHGVCGGSMQVWLERWQGPTAIALAQQIFTTLQAGQAVTLVTPFATAASPYVTQAVDPVAPSNTGDRFVEILSPPPTLLIVGAGHCGVQLATVAHLLGFQIVVQDDRPEWANSHHYPQARAILTDPLPAAIAQLADNTELYAALVTRGYTYDVAALTALLQRPVPCRYIGMIGSQKRVRQVFGAIAQAGMPASQLASIYAPIGLDIGALTPAEIAVSISAELIMVRRGGTGRSLSAQGYHREI